MWVWIVCSSETLAEIQKVMTEETGDVGVDSVFFTSFVMQ